MLKMAMRPLGALTSLALALTCAAATGVPEAAPAKPTPVRVTLQQLAPGDSLRYSLSWGSAARATGYQVTVTATGTGWSGLPSQMVVSQSTASFTAVSLGWSTVTFNAIVCSMVGTQVYTNRCASVSWSVSRPPATPGPVTVDSSLIVIGLSLQPKAVTVAAGGTVQFCPFFKLGDGAVGLRSSEYEVCLNAYLANYSLSERLLSPEQQQFVDAQCVTWRGTGGVLTVNGCDRVEPSV